MLGTGFGGLNRFTPVGDCKDLNERTGLRDESRQENQILILAAFSAVK